MAKGPLPPLTGRRPLIAGNWKMNYNHLEAIGLVQKLIFSFTEEQLHRVEVAVLPPFTAIRSVQTVIEGDQVNMSFGAQDVSPHDSGAYTGDVSGPMLAKLGCRYVVVGHSERRSHHGEDDAVVNAKLGAAVRNGLAPILCVGEQLPVREAGSQVEYCRTQLDGALAGLSASQVESLVVAYEPVWAIGTGEVASASDAQEMGAALRARLGELFTPELAESTRILYGGSVKRGNAGEILAQPDIDGALVGSASLDPEEFAAICLSAGEPAAAT